jgi:hypothetical protein
LGLDYRWSNGLLSSSDRRHGLRSHHSFVSYPVNLVKEVICFLYFILLISLKIN